MITLSHVQTACLPALLQQGIAETRLSLDLGLTQTAISLDQHGVYLPANEMLDWQQIEAINASPNSCYRIENQQIHKIQAFSETTARYYSLMPTPSAPTMLISGIPMHRIKDSNPWLDTQEKIKALQPHGKMLDTALGLGYTTIQAANLTEHVTTLELDPTVVALCHENPWSQPLFTSNKINILLGDSFDTVETMEDQTFSCILHDPPTFALAGHLYSTDFYRELWRILKPGGRLFHYIGNPDSKSGASVTAGATERLYKAGFAQVSEKRRAFGVLAVKTR